MLEFDLYWTACPPNESLTKFILVTFTQGGQFIACV